MIFGIGGWAKVAGGALLGAVIAYNAGHMVGHRAGYDAAEADAREHALDLMRKRSEDNAEIGGLDAAGLCDELGGEWVRDERRCD